MRILRVIRTYKPGIASQIGILNVSLQGSVPRVLPEGLQPIEGRLLNGAVVGIRRTGTAIPDDRSRMRCIRRIKEKIPSVIICSVVNRERLLRGHSPFETGGARTGMHHRKANIGTECVG